MADKFSRFLQGVGMGILNPKGNLGDFRHAARLYNDYTFSRAPRTKFSYHVAFDIEKEAIRGSDWRFKHLVEAGMLVKSADLPKFTYEHDVKNQYNKKKIIYKDIKYDPINIVLHDDNAGIINSMMALYYGYYSPERFVLPDWGYYSSGEGTGVGAGPYDRPNTAKQMVPIRYGLDSDGTNLPFFRSIIIYTMARKTYNSYILVRPHILNITHGNVNQSESNGTGEITMTLGYESVRYGNGAVIKGKEPFGFGTVHYDQTPSPMTIAGNAGSSIFGPLGILGDGGAEALYDASSVFKDLYQKNTLSGADLLTSAVRAVNFYKSIRSINKDTLAAEAQNLLLSPNALRNATSGLPGVSFPGLTQNNIGNNF